MSRIMLSKCKNPLEMQDESSGNIFRQPNHQRCDQQSIHFIKAAYSMSPASQVVLLLGSEGFASRIFLMCVILYRPNCRTTYENVMLSLLHLITGQYFESIGPLSSLVRPFVIALFNRKPSGCWIDLPISNKN